MLADQGATVIRVQSGNSTNPYIKNDVFTRGKSSVEINCKRKFSREFLKKEVLPKVNIILESYRPGTMERFGLAPHIVHEINPNLIYLRLSGYGQAISEYTLKAGHDLNYIALTGILNKFKRDTKGSNPVAPSNLLADFFSGSLWAFN